MVLVTHLSVTRSWKEPAGRMLMAALVCTLKRPEKHGTRSNQGSMSSRISPLPVPRVVAIILYAPGGEAALTSKLFFSFAQVLQGRSPHPPISPSPLEILFRSPFVCCPNRLPKAAVTCTKIEGSAKERCSREGGFVLPLRPFFLSVIKLKAQMGSQT